MNIAAAVVRMSGLQQDMNNWIDQVVQQQQDTSEDNTCLHTGYIYTGNRTLYGVVTTVHRLASFNQEIDSGLEYHCNSRC